MKYYKLGKSLYAYDSASSLVMEYDEVEWEWDLADFTIYELENKTNAQNISEKEAMEITGGHPPFQFLKEYLANMKMSR